MRQQCPDGHWFSSDVCDRCEWVPPEPPDPPAHEGFTAAREALAEAKRAKGVK